MIRTLQDHGIHQGITVHMEWTIVTLLKDGDRIAGAFGYDRERGRFKIFQAKAVVIASGGLGLSLIHISFLALHLRCEPNWPAVSYLSLIVLFAGRWRQVTASRFAAGFMIAAFCLGWLETVALHNTGALPLPARKLSLIHI